MVHHLVGKQRLVVAVGAGIAFAGHVGGGEGRDDAGLVERGRGIERRHAARARAAPSPARRAAVAGKRAEQIVGVQRLAGDVPARAFVRHGLPAMRSSRALPPEFLEQALRQRQAICRRAAMIADRLQRAVENLLRALDGASLQRPPVSGVLGFVDAHRRSAATPPYASRALRRRRESSIAKRRPPC